ncbi:MAG: tryptophan synthase subunit alpha [Euryarchaeota archaeon]|nr:tryptophan synthase subunit alpha [Euryarchaeota archaeon]
MKVESYAEMFKRIKRENESAFIPFVVAGDPDFETSLEIVKEMVEEGADALEIGFAFSDPVADGPTVQAADIRALEAGMNTEKGFEFIKCVREFTSIPIGLLVYYNLIYKNGINNFYKSAKKSGVNAVLAADLPPEEAENAYLAAKANGINQIFLAAQTTSNERLKKVVKLCSGFLYVVSVMGITGTRSDLKTSTVELIGRMRDHSKLPICVGFGISKPEHVKEVIKAGADGAIVGSAVIDIIAENFENKDLMIEKIGKCCREMKEATKR